VERRGGGKAGRRHRHSEGIEESLIVVVMKERFLDKLGMTVSGAAAYAISP
jgi:hypothetical protein